MYDDALRVGERPHLVFQSSEIDACLPADGGIDHGEQGGGDVDVIDAPLESGSGKAPEVGDHPSSETDEA